MTPCCRQQPCGLVTVSIQPRSRDDGAQGLAPHPVPSSSVGLQTDAIPATETGTATADAAAVAAVKRDAVTATEPAVRDPPVSARVPVAGPVPRQQPSWQLPDEVSTAGATYGTDGDIGTAQPPGWAVGIAVQPLGSRRGAHPAAAAEALNQSTLQHLLTLSDDDDYLALPLAYASDGKLHCISTHIFMLVDCNWRIPSETLIAKDSGSDSDGGAWGGLAAGDAAAGSDKRPWGGGGGGGGCGVSGGGSDVNLAGTGVGGTARQPADRWMHRIDDRHCYTSIGDVHADMPAAHLRGIEYG